MISRPAAGRSPRTVDDGNGAAFAPPAFSGARFVPPLGGVDHVFIMRALVLRDLRLQKLGLLTDFLRNTIVVIAHYYLFWAINKHMPANIPIEIFVISGFSVWFAFNYSFHGTMTGAKWPAGAILIPGVTRMHLRLAKASWAVLSNLLFCFVSIVFLRLYGDEVTIPDIPLTVLIFLLAGAMGFGFGLLLEGLGRLWPIVEPLDKIFTWALYVTCGLYFSLALMPPLLASIFWYNPILHLVEYQRFACDPGYPVALVTLLYPAAWVGGLLFIGLMTNRCMRHPDYD